MDQLTDFIFWYKRITFFKLSHQIEFIRLLASYLDDGINIQEALIMTAESYEEVYGSSHVAVEIANRIKESADKLEGYQIYIKEYFHPDIAVAFEIIQLNTHAMTGVTQVIDLVESEKKLKSENMNAIMMPLIIALVGLVILTAVGGFVIPMFQARAQDELSSPEISLAKGLWNFFTYTWFILIPFILCCIALYGRAQRDMIGSFRYKLDNIWPFKMHRQYCGIRLLRMMGLLKQSGCGDDEAYDIIESYSANYFSHFLRYYKHSFRIGESRAKYFGVGLLDKLQMIRLRRYFNSVDDATFCNAIIEISKKSEIDIVLASRTTVARYQLALIMFGITLGVIGVGVVLEGGMQILV
jgi:type II secretory pathway component PulF